MKCNLVSIDLAKTIFQICGFNDQREVLFNKKVKRSQLIHELRQIEPTRVVMEACYSLNPWGRRIEKLGHEVVLIPPFIVKAFLIGNKNDHNDAIAIGEAAFRPNIRFVAIKSVEQQDIQSLHRVVDLLKKQKIASLNQMRGLLAEYGIIFPKKSQCMLKELPFVLEDASNELSTTGRSIVFELNQHIKQLIERLDKVKQQLNELVKDQIAYKLLISIPGIGPTIAAAVLGSVNDPKAFKNGRQFAAWVGLTPSQYASGEMNRMGKITKRGNRILRTLLIHGARTVLNWCDKKEDPLSLWLKSLKVRMDGSKAVVALANKLARIVWSVLDKQQPFDVNMACHSHG